MIAKFKKKMMKTFIYIYSLLYGTVATISSFNLPTQYDFMEGSGQNPRHNKR